MDSSNDAIRTPSERASHAAASAARASEAVEHLSTAECWRLVEAGFFGRLAVDGLDGIPDIFPVNYTVHDGSIYIRSAPGSKLMAITARPGAAFEIDGEVDGFLWSVVLRGSTRRLAVDKEIRESGVQALVSSSPTSKYNYICLTPFSVSGRRFPATAGAGTSEHSLLKTSTSAHEPMRPHDAAVQWPHPDTVRSQRPQPIAHFPPL